MKERNPSLSIDEMEEIIGKKLENLVVRTHVRTSFSNARKALGLTCPADKPFREVYHLTEPAFGLRIMAPKLDGSVRKTWIVRYRDASRKDRKTSIAEATEKNYEEARFRAIRYLRDARRRRNAGLPAVPTLWEAFLDYQRVREEKWSESTKRMYKKATKYFYRFGLRPVDKVTPEHMEDLIRDIKAAAQARYDSFKKPTVKADGTASAKCAMRIMRAVYRDLIADGTVRHSPVAKLRHLGYFDRDTPRSDAVHRDQFPKFWAWLHESIHESTRDYILVGLFMAFRRSMLSNLEWRHVDHKARTYRILADAEGNKAKKEIKFPIPDYLWDHVFAPRWSSPNKHEKWIIPSPKRKGQPLRSIRGALKSLEQLTKVRLSVHGMRRTSATLLHAATGSELLAARLLTHKLDAAGSRSVTTAGYIITTDKELREAMGKMVEFALRLAKSHQVAHEDKDAPGTGGDGTSL